jgi:hypothetical protein
MLHGAVHLSDLVIARHVRGSEHNGILQACKVMGLHQDDLIATADIIAGKNVTATCHGLWSFASACIEQGIQVCCPKLMFMIVLA